MKLKVCGITNEADALAAAQAGVDYLGYVINYTVSPRFIAPATATHIVQRVKHLYPTVKHVAVLVSPTTLFLNELAGLPFDLFQVYGDVPQTSVPIWKSVIVRDEQDMISITQTAGEVAAIHCDAGFGSGQTIPYDILPQLKVKKPLVISGGITLENVKEIIQLCHPAVVDVNSGVETVPGKKDIQKIYALRQLIF